MSHNLGEVGVIAVGSFCGPEGRRESYQLTGPDGLAQLTWEEFCDISDLLYKAHGDKGGRELGRSGPVWGSKAGNGVEKMTERERSCFARGPLSGLHTSANAFLGSHAEVETFMVELKDKIMKEKPDAR